jgi:serine/threonine protein phosphatase PrpC
MTGSDSAVDVPPVAGEGLTGWQRHDNGRWIVGDAGRQPEVVPVPALGRAGTRPDTVVDGARLDKLTYRATSQRGLSHQQQGTPRQDAYLVRPTPDRRWFVGCVADGVSAAKLSHEAADLVCQELIHGLGRGLTELAVDQSEVTWRRMVDAWPQMAAGLPWQEWVDAANAAVTQAAKAAVRIRHERDGDTDALNRLDTQPWTDAHARTVMSSTAVAFAVSTLPVDDVGHPAVVLVVAGDSSALLLSGGQWTALTTGKPINGDIVSGAVQPLPRQVEIWPHCWFLHPGEVFAVVTDGLGDPLGSGGGIVGRFLAQMWAQPPDLLAFAQQVGFYRKSFTDDRTAVVVWADPAAPCPAT